MATPFPHAAASSSAGFFQTLPTISPQFTSPIHSTPRKTVKETTAKQASEDKAFARIISLYIPETEGEPRQAIHNLSRRTLDPKVLTHAVDAETNHPVLKPFNTFGQENKYDPLWTTAGWKALKAIAHEEGLVATPYAARKDAWNRRVHQFGLNHVWTCTGTMTSCPMSMTDGAAKLLTGHLHDPDGDQPGLNHVIRETHRRLISTHPEEAWTSGQWMTERTGGSDVSGTETIARRLTQEELDEDARQGRDHDSVGLPLGPWRIDGFKWFSSATDSDMTLMLAQTGKGLGLFYAPMRRKKGNGEKSADGAPPSELNGIRIQRLKNKVGTKSLPTAELELNGVRAWLIGKEGKGVKEISTILTITRLYTAAGAVGYWSRGLQVCRAYSKVRKVRGGLLKDNPMHLRWMADETVKYWAAAHFAFFGVALLGAQEQGWDTAVKNVPAANLIPKDPTEISILLRLLCPVMKCKASVAAVLGLRESMECLGGVGYCENNEDGGLLNISKIFRDNLVSPIWEGTVSVMAEDVVRVLTDKRIANGKVLELVFAPWVLRVLEGVAPTFADGSAVIVRQRLDLILELTKDSSKEELLFRGREILHNLEAIACSILLMYDAQTDGNSIAVEIARRWTRSKSLTNSESLTRSSHWSSEAVMDHKVFLGEEEAIVASKTKL